MNCFGSSSTNISGFKHFKLLYFSLVPVNKRNKLCFKIQYKLFYWWSLEIMTYKFVVPVCNPHHFPNWCHWLYLSSHCTVSFYVILIDIALNFPTQHLTNFTCCEFTANTALITWHSGEPIVIMEIINTYTAITENCQGIIENHRPNCFLKLKNANNVKFTWYLSFCSNDKIIQSESFHSSVF